ncbi:MAG: sigma-70 family RNA polymerase sigma factor [Flavobacteriaceae bacterium]|nr:sigma-70 family RNA polymerase sigma factor [Flavobacteriaceae bacterium]
MYRQKEIFDSILVDEIRSGNKKAFSLLVKRWQARFFAQAFWLTKNTEISKDITQESWEIVLLKLNQLKESRKFGSWGLSIVSRKAMDWHRLMQKENQLKSEYYNQSSISNLEANPETSEDVIVSLRKSINKLSEQQQIVLRLFYLEGFGLRQISRILEIPEGTVKSRLFNAREKLKKQINNRNYGKQHEKDR